MAGLYASINIERSIGFWQALAGHPQATDDDRRAFIRAMLGFGHPDLAAAELDRLLAQSPNDPELLRLQSAWHQARGETDAAMHVLRRLLATHSEDAAAALALASLRAAEGSPEALDEARSLLLRVMNTDGPESLTALEILARRMPLDADQAALVAQRIQQHPGAAGPRRLWLSELELRRQPERRERIINEVVAQHRHAPAPEQARAARWLNQQGAAAAVPEVIPLETARTRQDLFLIWADSMALQKKWSELSRVLQDPSIPIDRELATLFRARAAREMGDLREADLLWNRALSEATSRPGLLWYMARYAERLGDTARAAQVYETLTRTQADPRQAWLSLVRLHEAAGDTPALIRTLTAMAAHYPSDEAIRNDLAYLNLLTNNDVETAAADALARVAAQPQIMAYRITAAMALLRTGRAPEALRILEESGIPDWTRLQPGWRAVRAAVLGATGDHAAARQAARSIPTARLKPEERALIAVWQ
jgi:predicted Zn-dependent protease